MENVITVLVVEPGKALCKKQVEGTLKGFETELNSNYVKAIEYNEDTLIFFSYDDGPVTLDSFKCKCLFVKLNENRSYFSLSDIDIESILKQILPKLEYTCIEQTETGPYKWPGKILSFRTYGSHYEIRVNGRGTDIMVLFGRSSQGWFASIPDYDAGCHLAGSLTDHFYNKERLTRAIGDTDGITVAAGINYIAAVI